MKRIKRFLALFLCCILALSFAGCGKETGGTGDGKTGNNTEAENNKDSNEKGGGKKGEINVGIVLPTKDEPRWLQDQKRFEDIISDTDYSVEVLFSQGSSANEKTNVETLIARGMDVLIICAQDAAAAGASVEAAKKAGVTVISYDRLITDTDAIDYYVTFDSVSVGEAMGQYLADNASGYRKPPLSLCRRCNGQQLLPVL